MSFFGTASNGYQDKLNDLCLTQCRSYSFRRLQKCLELIEKLILNGLQIVELLL
jgi:hypothetical protein